MLLSSRSWGSIEYITSFNWLNPLLGMSRSCAQWQGQKSHLFTRTFLLSQTVPPKPTTDLGKNVPSWNVEVLWQEKKRHLSTQTVFIFQMATPKPIMDLGKDVLATQHPSWNVEILYLITRTKRHLSTQTVLIFHKRCHQNQLWIWERTFWRLNVLSRQSLKAFRPTRF